MNRLIEELVEGGVVDAGKVAMDPTFVKAYCRRDPHDNSRGSSDSEARVSRNGRTYGLGYKGHIGADLVGAAFNLYLLSSL